jgi:hypothetical protein
VFVASLAAIASVACVSATSTSTVRPASSKPTRPRSGQTALGEVVVLGGGCSWCSWCHGWAFLDRFGLGRPGVTAPAGAAFP